MPSSQPSVIPSSQPTSSPTTFDNPRYFSCGDQLTCESNSMEDCSFFTGNIVLQVCLIRLFIFTLVIYLLFL
jgi:hypothetical protein